MTADRFSLLWSVANNSLDISPAQQACLNALALHCHADGGGAYPSNRRLAVLTKYHPRTVKTARQALVERGIVVIEGRHRRCLRYRIVMAKMAPAEPVQRELPIAPVEETAKVIHDHPELKEQDQDLNQQEQRRASAPPNPPALQPRKDRIRPDDRVKCRMVHALLDTGAAVTVNELARHLQHAQIPFDFGALPRLIAWAHWRRAPEPVTPRRVLQRLAHTLYDDIDAGRIDARDTIEELKCRTAKARLPYRYSRDLQKALDAAAFQRRRAS